MNEFDSHEGFPRPIRISEAALVLGVHERYVRTLAESGALPLVQVGPRRLRLLAPATVEALGRTLNRKPNWGVLEP